MSVTTLPLGLRSRASRLQSPDDLVEALGIAFSDQQLAAITAPLEPGVIIAGAGSGKTTVMAARVVWLVGTGAVRPEQVLGLTFTRKAAAELSARVRSALVRAGVIDERGVDDAGEQLIMTYDAFAARLVAEHGLRIGVDSDATMITGATRFRLAARVVAAAAGPFDHISRLRPATVTERVLKLDADLQQHLVDPDKLDGHARSHRLGLGSAPVNQRGNVYAEIKKALLATDERLELASLVTDYQALKSRLGVVEFADQMAIAARLAVEVPTVSDTLRDAFTVVLLDEYQDTSAAQAMMLRGLFSGHSPTTGLGHPVTAVGDPFQAIYGWRGAAASNILQFADHFRCADRRPAARFALTVNRRSGQRILDVANDLARPLRTDTADRMASLTNTDPDDLQLDELRAPDGVPSGQVRAAGFETWPEEVSWIADQVVANRAGGEVDRWSEIAVLTRRNADIGPLYAELTARDVPTEIVGLGGLLSLPEVMDVVSTLRLVDDVTANPDLVRLLGGPRWNIGPRDLALLGRRARELAERDGARLPADGITSALEQAVADVDPTEVVSLLDALESPVGTPPEPVEGRAPSPSSEARALGPSKGDERSLSSSKGDERSLSPSKGDERSLSLSKGDERSLSLSKGDDRSLSLSKGDQSEPHTFSAEALERFTQLSAELSYLRRHSDEPLLDLVRRVINVLGLDVELQATDEFARTRRRDQLGAFLDAVADYVDVDGQASLTGLLAYLRAEVEQGAGLEQAVPTSEDSVKLLTVHKAKGLEWDVVYLPALMQGTFPSDRVSDNWVTSAAVLPADLRGDAGSIPQLADDTNAAITEYAARLKEQQLLAEDRLAYVAATRARQVLVGTGHTWRAEAVKPRVPSAYLKTITKAADRQGLVLAEAPPPADVNPLEVAAEPVPWPRPMDPDAWHRRAEAAEQVEAARRRHAETGNYEPTAALAEPLMLDQEEQLAAWDADIDHLLAEARANRRRSRDVELPETMSATSLLRLRSDPERYAAELARPMPRPPSATARFGTRFHQWVEHHLGSLATGQPSLIDPDDAADQRELDVSSEGELVQLCETFAAGPFGSAPPAALEAPFSVLIGGRVIRGRIDAVYEAAAGRPLPGESVLAPEPLPTLPEPVEGPPPVPDPPPTLPEPVEGPSPVPDPPPTLPEPVEGQLSVPEPVEGPLTVVDGGDPSAGSGISTDPRLASPNFRYRIVDWKTSAAEVADPWQLAIYRVAWAELSGVPIEQVDAVFYFVGPGTVVRPNRLADRAELERVLHRVPEEARRRLSE